MRVATRALFLVLSSGGVATSASELTPFPKADTPPAPAPNASVDNFKAAIASFTCPQLVETNQAIAAKAAAATTTQDKTYYTRLIGVIAEASFSRHCPAS